MKLLPQFALVCLLAPLFTVDANAVTVFSATLEGGQEVPPVATSAMGKATATLNDAKDRLEIFIEIFGLDLDGMQTPGISGDNVVAAHIHRAPAGVNGPVVFGFISPNNDMNGDLMIDPVAGTIQSAWDLPEGNGTTLAAELGNLLNNGMYLNVHTPNFPPGEIRGQLVRTPEPVTGVMTLLALGAVAVRGRTPRGGAATLS